MRKLVYIILLILVLLLSGCSKISQVFSTASMTPTPTIMPEPTPTVSLEIEEAYTPMPTSTPIPFHQLGFVNLNDHSSNLCVRSGPDISNSIIGAIKHGLTVRIFTEVDDWYEIS